MVGTRVGSRVSLISTSVSTNASIGSRASNMNDSPSTRTRKQVANAAKEHQQQQNGKLNGHINGSAVRTNSITNPSTPTENIFLFYPNIIGERYPPVVDHGSDVGFAGYSRIVLAIASLYYMPLHPRTCSLLYSISCLLDALDGVAARRFEQSTQFGAVLDMVTDRCTTSCLLVFLSIAFPRWTIVFQGLISLDLASHYVHMFATLTMGGSGQSHKKVSESRSKLLHLYYTNKVNCNPHLALTKANRLADCLVRSLCPQRAFLHCFIPSLVLLADLVAIFDTIRRQAGCLIAAR